MIINMLVSSEFNLSVYLVPIAIERKVTIDIKSRINLPANLFDLRCSALYTMLLQIIAISNRINRYPNGIKPDKYWNIDTIAKMTRTLVLDVKNSL
jgi:hypothetical protein